jgi:hypothetical protein
MGVAAAAVLFVLAMFMIRVCRKKEVERTYQRPLAGNQWPGAFLGHDDPTNSYPALLHQVWIGKKRFPPYKAVDALYSFDRINPDLKKMLWKDEDIHRLLEEYFPELRDIYRDYQYTMQRVNLTKYMTMYAFGGVYADLDVVAYQPLSELWARFPDRGAVFFIETVLTDEQAEKIGQKNSIRKRGTEQGFLGQVAEDRRRIASYVFMARPKHPLVGDMLEEAKHRSALRVEYPYDIMYTSGTDLFTTVVNHRIERYSDVLVLDRSVADQYFKHICLGSWVNFIDFPFRT